MNIIIEEFRRREEALGSSPDSYFRKYSLQTKDEGRVKCALSYLIEHNVQIHTDLNSTKNHEIGLRYINETDRKATSLSWQTRHDLYTLGIMYVDQNKPEIARAYANRSAPLYVGCLFNDCVVDINRAIAIGVPNNTKSKLYYRIAKCYLALDRKSSSRLVNTLVLARHHLKDIEDINKRTQMEEMIDNAHLNYTRSKPFNKIDYSVICKKIPLSNPEIQGASDAIKLNYSEKFGRHIVAARDIQPGEILLTQRDYASIIWPGLIQKYCWHCSKRVWAGIPCAQCTNAIYCNDYCRGMAWTKYHEFECRVVDSVVLKNDYYIENLLALRLALKTFTECHCDFKILEQKISEIEEIDDPIAKILDSNGMFKENSFASFYSASRKTSYMVNALRAVVISYYLAVRTPIFGNRTNTLKTFLRNKRFILISSLILRYIEITKTNNLYVRVNGDHDLQIKRGITFNPLVNYFNHSCDPMACLVHTGDMCTIYALQSIKKGEQIFVCYIYPFWNSHAINRRNMLQRFDFICECEPCKGAWGPDLLRLLLPTKMKPCPQKLVFELFLLKFQHKDESIYHTPKFTGRDLYLSVITQSMKLCQELYTDVTMNYIALKNRMINTYSCLDR
ncbi:hypothetical protein PV327_001379 [Microctonus hyperodae]|uniref:SET and MYND domain-containing protein 4 n=1 Tax=Microctonus hyperodae TaxID=165561 RepID=A0AA39G8G2_MICHY|nr:hypothetical protein PV327_001379 [Microctonus hyperodae]